MVGIFLKVSLGSALFTFALGVHLAHAEGQVRPVEPAIVAMEAMGCESLNVEIEVDSGRVGFLAEVAATPEARAAGLMVREALPLDQGMLFLFETPERAEFWMKDTRFSLDLLFIGIDGKIQHIHHRALPFDETPITAGAETAAVLEINGGLAAVYGVSEGDRVTTYPVDQQGGSRCGSPWH